MHTVENANSKPKVAWMRGGGEGGGCRPKGGEDDVTQTVVAKFGTHAVLNAVCNGSPVHGVGNQGWRVNHTHWSPLQPRERLLRAAGTAGEGQLASVYTVKDLCTPEQKSSEAQKGKNSNKNRGKRGV